MNDSIMELLHDKLTNKNDAPTVVRVRHPQSIINTMTVFNTLDIFMLLMNFPP